MANNIQASGRLQFNIGTRQIVGDATYTLYTTSSVASSEDFYVNVGTFYPLKTGSLSDLRVMYFKNETTTSIPPSVCIVSTDNAGSKVVAMLRAGEGGYMPWSGSTQLWVTSQVSQSFFGYQLSSS